MFLSLLLSLSPQGQPVRRTQAPIVGEAPGTTLRGSDPVPLAMARASLDQVWRKLRGLSWAPGYRAMAWERDRAEPEGQLRDGMPAADLHRLLDRLARKLGTSHLRVLEPGTEPAALRPEPLGTGTAGLELRKVEEQVVVFRVRPGGGSDRAGLRPGFVITAVEGVPVAALPRRGGEESALAAVGRALKGAQGATHEIQGLDPTGAPRTLRVELGAKDADPAGFTQSEKAGIAIWRFSSWHGDLMTRFRTGLAEPAAAKGLVIDLRGNYGGMPGLASGLAGLLSERSGELGRSEGAPMPPVAFEGSGPKAYRGPVAILVDGGTASASELFIAAMQEQGRIRVFGERSSGEILPSQFEYLPTGAFFQYPLGSFVTPRGVTVDGVGIAPDEAAPLTLEALRRGDDPALVRALAWIRTRGGTSGGQRAQ